MKPIKISRDDYNKSFDKAMNHFQVAHDIANSEHYDLALPHLILGMEELVKYQVYMLYVLNKWPFEKEIFSARRKSINGNHRLKHKLICELQEATTLQLTNRYLTLLILCNGNSAAAKSQFENKFMDWGVAFRRFGEGYFIPDKKMNEFLSLMDRADHIRNAYTYSDPLQSLNETTDEKAKRDYGQYLSFVMILIKQALFMKSVDLTAEEILEWQIKHLKPFVRL